MISFVAEKLLPVFCAAINLCSCKRANGTLRRRDVYFATAKLLPVLQLKIDAKSFLLMQQQNCLLVFSSKVVAAKCTSYLQLQLCISTETLTCVFVAVKLCCRNFGIVAVAAATPMLEMNCTYKPAARHTRKVAPVPRNPLLRLKPMCRLSECL